MIGNMLLIVVALVGAIIAVGLIDHNNLVEASSSYRIKSQEHGRLFMKRSPSKHEPKSMMHSHLSRKVFDRACAASKDIIDEVVACITTSDILTSTIKPEVAAECYKNSFGADFDPKEIMKHRDLICNNRDKFEDLTACVYRRTAEALDKTGIDKLAETMVDVGLCIINALDG